MGALILLGLILSGLFFFVLYQVIRAAVREGYLEAQRALRGEEPDLGAEDEEIYALHQEREQGQWEPDNGNDDRSSI